MTDEPLWSTDELTAAAGGRLEGDVAGPLTGVSIDSRTTRPGDVYVAIRGDVHDGHAFAGAALEAGAGLAIVSRPDDAMRGKGALLVVPDDPLDAMERLGRAARRRSGAGIVAVTGSVGKTGSKEMLRLALERSGNAHASVGSFNNHWGVPLTLARLPATARFGVFEVGMNAPGEIAALVDMIRPHVAIVTAVEAAHLDRFSRVEDIADAKAEIFSGVEPGGAAILNRDNPHHDRLLAAARSAGIDRVVGFGERADADARLLKAETRGDGSRVEADILGEKVAYGLGAPGLHFVRNSLAVLAAAKILGADPAAAAAALSDMRAPAGRGERSRLKLPSGGSFTLIDEAYNANPASMRAALALLGQTEPGERGRRVAVLGDMLELGEASSALHGQLRGPIDEADVDAVYVCGPMMARLWENLPAARRAAYAETSEELNDAVLDGVRSGDVVMIKGSLGSRMTPVVDALKNRYPELAAT